MGTIVTKLKSKKEKEMENIDFNSLLDEYQTINDKIKLLDKRKKEISKLVKDYSAEHGVKNSSGSMFCENDKFIFGQQARKSVKLNFERAREFFVANQLWDKVKVIKEDINEDEVEKLVAEGEITPEELETLVDIKTSYAVSIKEKTVQATEEMPEVQQMVASPKKKLLKRK